MEAYEGGGHAYHATLPTDALTRLRDVMQETAGLRLRQGARPSSRSSGPRCARCSRASGITSVAAAGFEAPGVVVSYTDDPGIQSGQKFLGEGLQTAAGVPLQCDEPPTSRPSASACSASTSCTMSSARWASWSGR